MPHRDDFEDFDKETENLVAQIADKSVEDEDLDIALKLAQCDIYERRLREQVWINKSERMVNCIWPFLSPSTKLCVIEKVLDRKKFLYLLFLLL